MKPFPFMNDQHTHTEIHADFNLLHLFQLATQLISPSNTSMSKRMVLWLMVHIMARQAKKHDKIKVNIGWDPLNFNLSTYVASFVLVLAVSS